MDTLTDIKVYPYLLDGSNKISDQNIAVPNGQGEIEYDINIPNMGQRNIISVQVQNNLLTTVDRKYYVIAKKNGNTVNYPHAAYYGYKSSGLDIIELDLTDH